MKNKKGFTLIEIIITVGLVGLLAIIVGANLVGMNNRQKDVDYERNIEKITSAAKTYVGLNKNNVKEGIKSSGSGNITLTSILSEGLISEGDLYDPRYEVDLDRNTYVRVTFNRTSGVFSYEYVEKQ